MDLLRYLSKAINFTYSLALSPDGQFGNYIIKNLTMPGAKKEWTGLIGKIGITSIPKCDVHDVTRILFDLQGSWCTSELI
jgi:hypothetical protein